MVGLACNPCFAELIIPRNSEPQERPAFGNDLEGDLRNHSGECLDFGFCHHLRP
jgi:hypothetical protein